MIIKNNKLSNGVVVQVKIIGEIDVSNWPDRLFNFFCGTTAKVLITSGFALLGFGLFDTLTYIAELLTDKPNPQHPGEFGWQSAVGLTSIALGLTLKLLEYFYTKRTAKVEKETEFFNNFNTLEQPEFRAACKSLFGLINPDVKVGKKVLSHPSNQGACWDAFRVCHTHIKECNPWLSYSSSMFKFRHFLSGLFCVVFIPFMVLMILAMFGLEVYQPGITKSGDHAAVAYLVLAGATILGGMAAFSDYKKMEHAITLVEELDPRV